MAWCLRLTRTLHTLILLALFGILESTSQTPKRELEGMGSIDCPHSFTVHWNKILARPPYVHGNITSDFDGLFPSNVFEAFHAFPITATFFLSILTLYIVFHFLAYDCLFKRLVWCEFQRL